jgi:molecular chaperone HtpG
MGGMIDSHFTGLLERTLENASLVSVDSGSLDSLVDKGEERTALISETEAGYLKKEFEEVLKNAGNYTVETKALGEQEPPLLLTQPEFMRRMRDMAAMGQMSMMGNFPETWNAVLNTAHPSIARIARETEIERKQEKVAQITDLALLAAGKLSGERLAVFVQRSLSLM